MTCEEIVMEWMVTPEVAILFLLQRNLFRTQTGRDVSIISGARTCAEQERLGEQGRPTAPCDLSNHVVDPGCLATALDLRVEGFPARAVKAELGRAGIEAGFRWGGGSPVEDGIPSDWNHFDLGPKNR